MSETTRSDDEMVKRFFDAKLASETAASAPPTRKQLEYLIQLGCGQVPRSRSEASRLINEWLPCPTRAQLDFLSILGYTGESPETKFGASKLIDRLVE